MIIKPKDKPKGKPRGKPFKPGNNANPKGRGASIPILKVFKEYTTKTVAEMYMELMELTIPQLQALVDSDTTPALRKVVAQVLIRDMNTREMDYSERVLNRIIGPIPARQEVSGANGVALVPPSITIVEALPPESPT
jgi:hypothetical protein